MTLPFRSWNQVPFDVLKYIFDILDNETLLSACLVNRTVNEVASRSLYATLVVNRVYLHGEILRKPDEWEKHRKNAFLVFKRKPMLRLVVKSVILYPSMPSFLPFYLFSHDKMEVIETECYLQLRQLKNVQKITLEKDSLTEQGIGRLLDVFSALPLLTTLIRAEGRSYGSRRDLFISSSDYSKLSRIQNLAVSFDGIRTNTVERWAVSAIASKIKQIKVHNPNIGTLEHSIKAFSYLRELNLFTNCPDPVIVCRIISEAENLTHVTLVLRFYKRWNRKNDPAVTAYVPDTGLSRLISLDIRLQTRNAAYDRILLQNLVRALASHSRLRKLSIASPNSHPPYMQCNSLISQVISSHGATLEKLQIPFFQLPTSTFTRVMSQCKRLKVLWIAARQGIRPSLPQLLAASTSLETVGLFGNEKWLNFYAGSLLSQVNTEGKGSSLREIWVCSEPHHGKVLKTVWRVTWEYDDELARAIRRVTRPSAYKSTRGLCHRYENEEDYYIHKGDCDEWDENGTIFSLS